MSCVVPISDRFRGGKIIYRLGGLGGGLRRGKGNGRMIKGVGLMELTDLTPHGMQSNAVCLPGEAVVTGLRGG